MSLEIASRIRPSCPGLSEAELQALCGQMATLQLKFEIRAIWD